ncbi:MAG: zf-HC2 domain-containing protein [bacterium]|nr:zf-HC2 domain-containing protein [bacterium]
MKCGKVRENLVLFLDGELPAGQAERLREHLAVCQACRAEAELLASTLNLAVQRAHESTPPAVPQDFISRFWEKERRQHAGASRETRRLVSRRTVWSSVRGIRARYAIAGVSAILVAAFAIVTLLRDGDVPEPRRSGKSREQLGLQQHTVTAVDRFAEIEKQLAELEAAVQKLRAPARQTADFTGAEMKEIYAAIGLAAANNYRDVLNMNDVAAKKYAHVASTFPETTAGREAQEILSRLN